MAEAGTLLHTSDVVVGDHVQARDLATGVWYNATVISLSGRARQKLARVHFVGFSARYDTWYAPKDHALRVRLAPADLKLEQDKFIYKNETKGRLANGCWLIDRLIAKRTLRGQVEYRVRWLDWDAAYDTWESKLDRAIIQEYEDELEESHDEDEKQRVSKKPFSIDECQHESEAIAEQRIQDVEKYIEDLMNECLKVAPRIKEAIAEFKIYSTKPITSAEFVALHKHFVRKAAAMGEEGREVDIAVTPIEPERCGLRPVDIFAIMDDAIVNNLLGDKILTIHEKSGAAVKLVAPFDFMLRARRNEQGDLALVKELVVKIHAAALVPDLGNPGHPIFKVDDKAFAYPEGDRVAYKKSMSASLLSAAARGVVVSPELLAWAQAH